MAESSARRRGGAVTSAHNRVAVLHGVNFDILHRRDPDVYGGLSLNEVGGTAAKVGLCRRATTKLKA